MAELSGAASCRWGRRYGEQRAKRKHRQNDRCKAAACGTELCGTVHAAFFRPFDLVLLIVSLFDYSDRTVAYGVTVLGIAILLYNIVQYGVLTRVTRFILPGLTLSVIGVISFTHSRVTGLDNSYGAAIIPLFLILFSCFPHPIREESGRIAHHFHMLLIVLSVVMLLARMAGLEFSHQNMVIAFFALSLSVAMWNKSQIILLVLIISIYTLYRPSSTIVVSMMMTLAVPGLGLVSKPALFKVAKLMILASTVYNVLILLYPHLLQLPFNLEQDLKQDFLGAHSNSEFRLAVLESASEAYHNSSLVFGSYFSGSINAQHMEYFLPWWHEFNAPIHSDFAIIVLQGGIFGAALLALFFIKLVSFLQIVAENARPGDRYTVGYCQGTVLSIMNFTLFANFNPMMGSLSATICIYALIYGASFMMDRQRVVTS